MPQTQTLCSICAPLDGYPLTVRKRRFHSSSACHMAVKGVRAATIAINDLNHRSARSTGRCRSRVELREYRAAGKEQTLRASLHYPVRFPMSVVRLPRSTASGHLASSDSLMRLNRLDRGYIRMSGPIRLRRSLRRGSRYWSSNATRASIQAGWDPACRRPDHGLLSGIRSA